MTSSAVSYEVIIAALLGLMMFASFVSLRSKLPYTLVLVFVGLGLTGAIAIAGWAFSNAITTAIISLETNLVTSGLLVGLVVPPLIFEAMIHIKSADLKAVIRPSSILATLGVVIATIVCGLVLWKVARLPFYISFLFAALISPTDSATVLEVFKKVRVPSRLSALMDTEAAFNDATAIVIFSIVATSATVQSIPILPALGSFAVIVGGGVLVGFVVAFMVEVLTSMMEDRASETVLTIVAVYGSYAIASAFGFSGLIAVAIVGLYSGNFTVRTAMDPSSREAVSIFWEIAAFLANSVAFLAIGLTTNITSLASISIIALILIAFGAVTLSRMASVYPILSLFNRAGRNIPRKWQNVAVLGGIRGALSIALVFTLYTNPEFATLKAMVFGVALISLSLQPALLFRYADKKFPEERADYIEELNVKLSGAVSAIESLQKMKQQGRISEEDFATELEEDKDQLRDVLRQIRSRTGTTRILKERASDLYSSLISHPVSRATQILRGQKTQKGFPKIAETATPPSSSKAEEEGKNQEEVERSGGDQLSPAK